MCYHWAHARKKSGVTTCNELASIVILPEAHWRAGRNQRTEILAKPLQIQDWQSRLFHTWQWYPSLKKCIPPQSRLLFQQILHFGATTNRLYAKHLQTNSGASTIAQWIRITNFVKINRHSSKVQKGNKTCNYVLTPLWVSCSQRKRAQDGAIIATTHNVPCLRLIRRVRARSIFSVLNA